MPWFRVIGERFDWFPKRNTMISYKRGTIGYQTHNCVHHGVKCGLIEEIEKPANAKVSKSGKVIWNAN